MKKQNILISLLAILCLTSCNNPKPADNSNGGNSGNEGGNSSSQKEDKSAFVINSFGKVKFEAEDFNVDNWDYDYTFDGVIVEDSKASNGAFLAGADPGAGVQATFSFEIKAHSLVTMSVAYAQTEDWLEETVELDKTYVWSVKDMENFSLPAGKNTLKPRTAINNFELISYNQRDMYPGVYSVTLLPLIDATKGYPSIDYIQFETKDADNPVIDPSELTEDDIPDNDFHNLQQYKYLKDSDVGSYKTYATGADLSAPKGIKLDLSSLDNASKYYVQISESNSFTDALVRETTEKSYQWYNAKLGTKYYWRAATSEAGLASATVKDITVTNLAPRVCYVPNVLNFRDIGGWESSLVAGAKVKQGLYYRCAQLNQSGYSSTRSELDSAGKGLAAIKELGIKVDIDMRDSGNVPSASPANTTDWPVALVKASVPSGSEPVRWEGGTYQGTNIANQYVTIFNALYECDTKPVALHCTYGADRTGIATFFLEALIGMSIEDMTRDYLWTQFTQGRSVKYTESDAEFPKWIEKTEALEGATFADKMENHLISFGIEKAKLEHIREIFVPGYVAQA